MSTITGSEIPEAEIGATSALKFPCFVWVLLASVGYDKIAILRNGVNKDSSSKIFRI